MFRGADVVAKKYPVQVKVNGKVKSADVEPRLLLVHLLRDEFGEC